LQKLLEPGNNRVKIHNSTRHNKNNPLHWAIFYGDYDFGKAIFDQYPLIILRENEKGISPLEMCIQIDLKKLAANNAKKLISHIISQFLLYFFDDQTKTKYDLIKNATK
jgi:hypothetical protein